ncbi:hypothetical protein WMY93_019951 [Mugilogobius chulae]|uniref:KIND domain-containing protein n=1 Tax=Mugilogobius chulae TaxID=88201 RepID=A0AAW0NGT7_9GOBI
MAKRPGTDDGMLPSPTIPRDFAVDFNTEDLNLICGDGAEEVSLEEILSLYSQPINEEQAWAVCYQCCRTLAQKRRRKGSKSTTTTSGSPEHVSPRRIEGPGDVAIGRDGTVKLVYTSDSDKYNPPPTSLEVIDSLGIMIYKALDYGLKENEERELSPPLERLIDMMTNTEETESDSCPDEGYEATEEEEEEEGEDEDEEPVSVTGASTVNRVKSYKDVLMNLRKMEGETREESVQDLNELQNSDWARFWVQVMRDLRNGVKLKKVQERQYNPLPIEYQLTPYEMLMDDIRSKRYKLRKVMVNGDIPPRLKKSAHEIILEFIRSRPPLNPVAARKLKPHPPRPRSLHERLLEDIKAERKLRPVSPDMIRRHRLGAGKSISTPQDLFRSSAPPKFLPVSATPQPDKRQASPQRRHSIEKEAPTSVRPFLPPSKQSSKSLVKGAGAAQGTEEFCYPVECLALTVEEVMHIRQVLVKAELEKFQQYKDVYNALKKGKLCFSCRTKRFSFFTWSYTCQFCKRPVCSQCSKKMRLPSKPYSTLPIYSLGPSSMAKEEGSTPAPDTDKQSFGHHRGSLRRSVHKMSKHTSKDGKDDLELPKELTEDWVTMEVCVDCKKFITEIISSSKRSLSVATKRARLNRKTQSFYLSSSSSANFRSLERTINEV